MSASGRDLSGPWLDKEIDGENKGVHKHLGRIAETMYEWEGRIAEELGLTPADVAAIKTKYPSELGLQTREALLIWKQRRGKDATYRNLILVFKKAGYQHFADYVATKAASGENGIISKSAIEMDNLMIQTIRSNEAKIKDSFSELLDCLEEALTAHTELSVDKVHRHLMVICPAVSKASLSEMFDFVTAREGWNYQNYSPLDNFVKRFLPDQRMQMVKYKNDISGFCVTTKLVHYIRCKNYSVEDLQKSTDRDQPSWNEQHHYHLKFRLGMERKVTELSLQYVYDLWEDIAEQFDVPCLTTIIHKIIAGSLVVVWLVLLDTAKKIASCAFTEESIRFFLQCEIVFVAIDEQPIFDATQFLLRMVKQNNWQELNVLMQEHRELFDLNASHDGKTLLMSAAELGHEHVIEILLDHGADITLKQEYTGRTALFFAAENDHDAAKAILLAHGADPHQTDSNKAPISGERAPSLTLGIDEGSIKQTLLRQITSSDGSASASAEESSIPVVAKKQKIDPVDEKSELMFEQEYDVEVTNAHLSRMSWNENGKEQTVRIYDESSHKWHEIGENLGIDDGILVGIGRDGRDERDRVIKVLGKWYENACGLPHYDDYPRTWGGLLKLLDDSGLRQLARKVQKALLQQKKPSISQGSTSDSVGASKQKEAEEQSKVVFKEVYSIEVTNDGLSRMEWIEDGEKQVVRIYEEASHKWHEIGTNLGIDPGVLVGIGQDGHNVRDRLIKVLTRWYDNACGLRHPKKFPRTWRGLINLLDDSGLNELAKKVHKAVSYKEQQKCSAAEGPSPSMQQSPNPAVRVVPGAPPAPGNGQNEGQGPCLTINDLAEVNDAVRDARAKYHFIGLALGILPGDLAAIKKKHDDPAECLTDVLTEFLQKEDPKPKTWKRLADAMASGSVGRGDIAAKLRKR